MDVWVDWVSATTRMSFSVVGGYWELAGRYISKPTVEVIFLCVRERGRLLFWLDIIQVFNTGIINP